MPSFHQSENLYFFGRETIDRKRRKDYNDRVKNALADLKFGFRKCILLRTFFETCQISPKNTNFYEISPEKGPPLPPKRRAFPLIFCNFSLSERSSPSPFDSPKISQKYPEKSRKCPCTQEKSAHRNRVGAPVISDYSSL